MPALRLAIVEDQPILRTRLRKIVHAQPDWTLVWEAGSLAQARANLSCAPTEVGLAVDVIIIDIGLPDGSGLTLLPALACSTRALMYSVLGDEEHVIQALSLGAAGYLLKEAGASELISAVESVHAGGAPLTPSVAAHLLKRWANSSSAAQPVAAANPPDQILPTANVPVVSLALPPKKALAALTPREREVLLALARGYSYDESGKLLGISPHTIAHHVKQIYGKLAVNSKSAAVFEAIQAGWL
jgi:DNA-binding NarL/FixJ family response regulator